MIYKQPYKPNDHCCTSETVLLGTLGRHIRLSLYFCNDELEVRDTNLTFRREAMVLSPGELHWYL